MHDSRGLFFLVILIILAYVARQPVQLHRAKPEGTEFRVSLVVTLVLPVRHVHCPGTCVDLV